MTTSINNFTCKACDKSYKHQSGLSRHKKASEKCKQTYLDDADVNRQEYKTSSSEDLKPFDYDMMNKLTILLLKKYTIERFMYSTDIIAPTVYDFLIEQKIIKFTSKRLKSFKTLDDDGKVIVDANLKTTLERVGQVYQFFLYDVYTNICNKINDPVLLDNLSSVYLDMIIYFKDSTDFYINMYEIASEDPVKKHKYMKKLKLFFEDAKREAKKQMAIDIKNACDRD